MYITSLGCRPSEQYWIDQALPYGGQRWCPTGKHITFLLNYWANKFGSNFLEAWMLTTTCTQAEASNSQTMPQTPLCHVLPLCCHASPRGPGTPEVSWCRERDCGCDGSCPGCWQSGSDGKGPLSHHWGDWTRESILWSLESNFSCENVKSILTL